MKKKILILTKSNKHNAKCVVGIDIETKELIRLVTNNQTIHYSVEDSFLTYGNGNSVNLFHIVEVSFIGKQNNIHQPENWIIDEKIKLKKVELSENEKLNIIKNCIESCISQEEFIYIDTKEFLTKDDFEKVNSSIALFYIQNVRFNIYQPPFSPKPKTKVSFEYNNKNYDNFSFTSDISTFKDCKNALAVITLPDGEDKFCIEQNKYYKFVAQIYNIK